VFRARVLVQDLGLRLQALVFRVVDYGFGVWGLGLENWGLAFRV